MTLNIVALQKYKKMIKDSNLISYLINTDVSSVCCIKFVRDTRVFSSISCRNIKSITKKKS